jgi:hypothetical protein
MTTTESKLSLIADRVQAARLRRTIRYLEIDNPLILPDGAITRLSNRQVRYDMRGVSVKLTAMWHKLVDYLLVALELDTETAQAAYRERVQDAIMDVEDAA